MFLALASSLETYGPGDLQFNPICETIYIRMEALAYGSGTIYKRGQPVALATLAGGGEGEIREGGGAYFWATCRNRGLAFGSNVSLTLDLLIGFPKLLLLVVHLPVQIGRLFIRRNLHFTCQLYIKHGISYMIFCYNKSSFYDIIYCINMKKSVDKTR